ncbi:hypothetical protein PS645_02313 [Pseudomonas fluorescens]|uniref:Uncharacterized protein n=1 Tax=Pseudomonas fluorescens TaxID=294 RepID=A0A5E6SLL6_PSEFL|nr:hypothetical protein PS645_02313 [Pseudomonas fluorescens]
MVDRGSEEPCCDKGNSCGEGACPRWDAKRPPASIQPNGTKGFTTAAQPNGAVRRFAKPLAKGLRHDRNREQARSHSGLSRG